MLATGQNGRKTPASRISNTEVRTWAKAQGLEIKERGRPAAGCPSGRALPHHLAKPAKSLI